MGNQVKTPRFYVNVLEWLNATGYQESINSTYRTLPVNVKQANVGANYLAAGNYYYGEVDIKDILNENSFAAFLGTEHLEIFGVNNDERGSFSLSEPPNYNEVEKTESIVNFVHSSTSWTDTYNGFAIGTFNGGAIDAIELRVGYPEAKIGSCVIGTFFDMPHSPDLNLTMTMEYGGTKTLETKGGSYLSNTMWSKKPSWGGLSSWELFTGSTSGYTFDKLALTGRRIWSLSFSYLDQESVFPENLNLTSYGTDYFDNASSYSREKALFHGSSNDNIISELFHKTNGGTIPFIFQPDNTNNNPDQFAICVLDQDSFQFKKITDSMYNISLTIREVW
jgi:hypothetical protein